MNARTNPDSPNEEHLRMLAYYAAVKDAAIRVLDMVQRYFQFRIRDLHKAKIPIVYNSFFYETEDSVVLVLRIYLPQHLKEVWRVDKLLRKMERRERYLLNRELKLREFEDFEEEAVKEVEEYERGGVHDNNPETTREKAGGDSEGE